MRSKTAITIILGGVSIIFMVSLSIYHSAAVVPLTLATRNYIAAENNKDPVDLTAETLESMERLKNDLDALHISIAAFEDILIYKIGSNQNPGRSLDIISSE
jgi:hypothetical protein